MTDDHRFTDTLGNSVYGKANCLEAWRGFFEQFPDYRNTFVDIRARDDLVIVVGYSTCSVEVLSGPAIWTATIRNDGVAHWRVYEDAPEVRGDLGIPG